MKLTTYNRTTSAARNQFGQSLTEYLILVALVVVAGVGVLSKFGEVLHTQFAAVAAEIAGEDGSQYTEEAALSSQDAFDLAEAKELGDFAAENDPD